MKLRSFVSTALAACRPEPQNSLRPDSLRLREDAFAERAPTPAAGPIAYRKSGYPCNLPDKTGVKKPGADGQGGDGCGPTNVRPRDTRAPEA